MVRRGGRAVALAPPPSSFGTVYRPRAFVVVLARNVTRVLRGDFFPSRNDTRLAPVDFGALNFTRIRRGIFFPSRKVTVCRRFAAMVPWTGRWVLSRRSTGFKQAVAAQARIGCTVTAAARPDGARWGGPRRASAVGLALLKSGEGSL